MCIRDRLNCGLGTVMLPILGVLLLVKSSDLLPVIYEMAGGEASGLLATMLCAALCLEAYFSQIPQPLQYAALINTLRSLRS